MATKYAQDITEIKRGVKELQDQVTSLEVGLARVEEHLKCVPALKQQVGTNSQRISRLEGIGTFAGTVVGVALAWLGLRK